MRRRRPATDVRGSGPPTRSARGSRSRARRRLTIAFAALALLLVACSGAADDAGVDLAATPVATPPAVPSVEPTPAAPSPAPLGPFRPTAPPTTGPTSTRQIAPLGSRFTIRFGETVAIENTVATITLAQVVQDSRCPTDVTCIRAGDVTLRFATANTSGATMIELTIGDRGDPAASFDGLTVTLLEVAPIPRSTGTIDPLSYSATLIIELNGS